MTKNFVMYFNTKKFGEDGPQPVTLPDPKQPYCEFAYLNDGWELRLVYNKGIVRTVQ